MKIFYGPKGTGKTKAIIDCANGALAEAKGHVIFITDTKRYTHDIKLDIRFLDTSDFEIRGEDGFRGFIKGEQPSRLFFLSGETAGIHFSYFQKISVSLCLLKTLRFHVLARDKKAFAFRCADGNAFTETPSRVGCWR